MIHRGDRCDGGSDRERALLSEFKEEHPDAACNLGCRASPLPRQGCARRRVAAFDLGDRFRFQCKPIQPAMHLCDVAGSKADARQPLALLRNYGTNPLRGCTVAAGRHQLKRHVIQCEQDAVGAIAGVSPRRRPREQRLVGRQTRLDIAHQHDDMIDPADHGNSPRVVFAARTFSTPIAIAAVRWEILSAFERATIRSKARSRM